MIKKTLLFLIPLTIVYHFSIAQTATIFGKIIDEKKQPLQSVTVANAASNQGVLTDEKGKYELKIPAGKKVTISFSFIGYQTVKNDVTLKDDEKFELNETLKQKGDTLNPTTIQDKEIRDQPGLIKINPKDFEALPTPNQGVEAILKLLGASSNDELSSQYSVHGGNFDENLVYVNDFEIFRPFLVSSGQQEGLSFPNPDLVGSMLFSEGGFQAKYGDKMSSVLDIQYKKPTDFGGSVSLSLLGGSAHLEGSTKSTKHRLTYLVGFRQKTTKYLLNSLQTQADYEPSFIDAQGLITYELSSKWHLELIGNYSRNKYLYIPESRVTSFGVVNSVIQLNVDFQGQELDQFISGMGGLSATYKPNKKLTLKFLTSAYRTQEDETSDIISEYYLGEVQTDLSKSNYGQVIYGLGTGSTEDWERDYLTATVANVSHHGSYIGKNQFIQWGVEYQREMITDNLNEWGMVDSAFYNIPYSPTSVNSNYAYKTQTTLNSNRFNGYLQDSWSLGAAKLFYLTAGTRSSYWDVNKQFLFTPRAQLSYKPKWDSTDIVFRAAIGEYAQPPFFKELMDLEGVVHTDVKAQQSLQYVLGFDYNFKMWNRQFKFITEAYYKQLWDLNPYDVNDVLIRYFGNNSAKGFATGIDFRLHGQFTKDLESWITLSLLDTKEEISGDYYYNYQYKTDTINGVTIKNVKTDSTKVKVGYIPRPTDQPVNVGMFFQDYLPGHENFKVYLNLLFGSGFPTGPPDNLEFRDVLRLPPYRRLDIGFSYLLLDGTKPKNANKVWKTFKSIWISLEVFNLLQIQNTLSYLWVRDNNGTIYAVPDYLTSRRVNVRLIVKF